MTKIYISGPIAAEPQGLDYAKQAFADAADLLKLHNYEPINPFEVGACDTGDCVLDELRRRHPDKTNFAAVTGEHTWSCYMRYDLVALLGCNGVANLPGWEHSPGARLENAVAIQVGIRCLPLDAWLDNE